MNINRIISVVLLLFFLLHDTYSMDTDTVHDENSMETIEGLFDEESIGKFPGIGYHFCKDLVFEKGFFEKDKLYVIAFNVSQGNCIILRKENNVVIIDCGKGNFYNETAVFHKIQSALEGATISAVVLSHAHDDHFNLLQNLLKNQKKKDAKSKKKSDESGYSFSENLQLILGGYKTELDGKLKNIPKDAKKHYTSDKKDIVERKQLKKEIENTLNNAIPDVTFEIILPPHPLPAKVGKEDKPIELNRQSIILKVTYQNKSVLFTGDAESITLDNIIGHDYKGDVDSYEKLKKHVDKSVLKQEFEEKTDDGKKKEFSEISNENRNALKNINLLVLPHHGSESEGSGRWLNYINGSSKKTLSAALVSSLPVSTHFLPSRFIVEGNTETEVPEHLISYQRLFVTDPDEEPTKRRFYKFTTKPIYTTGTAPGGFYCFAIEENKHIKIFIPKKDTKHVLKTDKNYEKDSDGWCELKAE